MRVIEKNCKSFKFVKVKYILMQTETEFFLEIMKLGNNQSNNLLCSADHLSVNHPYGKEPNYRANQDILFKDIHNDGCIFYLSDKHFIIEVSSHLHFLYFIFFL